MDDTTMNEWLQLKSGLLGLCESLMDDYAKMSAHLEAKARYGDRKQVEDDADKIYFFAYLLKKLSDDGKSDNDSALIKCLLRVDGFAIQTPILFRMLDLCDSSHKEKHDKLKESIEAFCENQDDNSFLGMMRDYFEMLSMRRRDGERE